MIELFQPSPVRFPIIGARLVSFELEEDKPALPVIKPAKERGPITEFARFKKHVLKKDGDFTSRDFEPDFPMRRASAYINRLCARRLIWDTTRSVFSGGKPLKIYQRCGGDKTSELRGVPL